MTYVKNHWNVELNIMKNERKYLQVNSLRYAKKQAHKESRANARHIINEALNNELH